MELTGIPTLSVSLLEEVKSTSALVSLVAFHPCPSTLPQLDTLTGAAPILCVSSPLYKFGNTIFVQLGHARIYGDSSSVK